MPEYRPSTAKLMAALRAAIGTFGMPSPPQEYVWARAGEDYYHDCWSPLATPIMQLVTDLRAADWPEIAERAIQGEFDATSEEFAEWRRSPEGQEVFSKFNGGE